MILNGSEGYIEGSTFFLIMVPSGLLNSGHLSFMNCSFQKSNIGWPQQPPTEMVLISVKNWIFDDPFHKKGPVLVILVPGMMQLS